MAEEISLKDDERILVSRTDRLGDLILALPLIESIKARYPKCHIDVMASDYASPVLENHDYVRKVIKVDNAALRNDKACRRELRETLQNDKYRAALVLFPEKIISRIIYKAKIPVRIGTARRFQSIYFNRFLFHGRRANKKHESEYNLDFLKFFRPGRVNSVPHVYLEEDEINTAGKVLESAGVSGRFIVLHPGSGGSADRWPLGHFVKLYYILKSRNYPVIITGSMEEKDEINRVAEKINIAMVNLAGKTDIRTLAGLLSLASLAIANSTGPLHLAAAVGTRVIGLYPHTRTMSPVRWGPLGTGHQVILPPPESQNDMSGISPEHVPETAVSMMSNSEVIK